MREVKQYEKYRVGNFKIELINMLVNDKGECRELLPKAHMKKEWLEKNHYEQMGAVKVVNLEETWCVRIPQHFVSMYGTIVDALKEDTKEANDILTVILTNFNLCTSVVHGWYQNLTLFAARCYVDMTAEGESFAQKKAKMEKLKEEFGWQLDAYLETYKQGKDKDMSDEDFKRMQTASEMKELLEK